MKPTLKRVLITLGLEVLAAVRAEKIVPSFRGRGMIFTLHHVRPQQNHDYDPNALLSITPDFLASAIEEALDLGYEPAALSRLPHLIETTGESRRFVAFTLDDGWKDNAAYAAPVFRKYNIPYTLFITKGFVERTHTMWWETAEALTRKADTFEFDFGHGKQKVVCMQGNQKLSAAFRISDFIETIDEAEAVKRLNKAASNAGIDPFAIVENEIMSKDELLALKDDPLVEFGAHTVSHRNVARLEKRDLNDELKLSHRALTNLTGNAPAALAYPYGWKRACGRREADAAAELGFKIAVTTQPGILKTRGQNDWHLLPRVSLNGYYQKRRYVRALLSGIPFRFL